MELSGQVFSVDCPVPSYIYYTLELDLERILWRKCIEKEGEGEGERNGKIKEKIDKRR